MTLLTGRFTSDLQMKLFRGSVGIVAEDTLGQDFIVMSVARCKQFLLVAAEAGLLNSGPLEISWLFSMTVLTFCLRRMCPVNRPTLRIRCVSRRSNEELAPLKCVAALPGHLVLSRCDS